MGSLGGEKLGTVGDPFGDLAKPIGGIDDAGNLVALKLSGAGVVVAEGATTLEAAARGLNPNLIFVQRHSKIIAPNSVENALSLGGYTVQTAQAQRSIRSTNANDTAAGTGARKIELTYLDSTKGTLKTEVITLNGTSWVNTSNTDIHYIHDVNVISVGSNGSPHGDIEINTATGGGGSVFTKIVAGQNEWLTAYQHIPADRRLFITSILASSEVTATLRYTSGIDHAASGGGIVNQSREMYFGASSGSVLSVPNEVIIVDPSADFNAFVSTSTGKNTFLTITGYEVMV